MRTLLFLLLALPVQSLDRIERRRDSGPAKSAPAPQSSERVRIVPGTPVNPRPQTYHHYYYGGYDPYRQRWWDGRWWWRHPHYNHWHYWDDGYWIQAPVYYEVPPAQSSPAPAAAPAGSAPSPGGSWTSPDGRRLVQVAGPTSDAFLYDVAASTSSARFLGRLAGGVERARFTGGKDGRPLKILLDLRDGSFSLFDADGKPLSDK